MANYDELLKKYGGTVSEQKSANTDDLIAQFGGSVTAKEPTTFDQLKRGLGIAARAIAPTATGAAIGSAAGPVGTIVGGMAVPIGDSLNSLINLIASPFTDKRLPMASESIQNLMTQAGVPGAPETQTTTERVLSTGLEALTGVGTAIPSATKLAASKAPTMAQKFGQVMGEAPKTQAVVTPTATMAGQAVSQATGSPAAGLATSLATGGVGSVKRPQREEALSSTTLNKIASDRYQMLEQSGIKLKSQNFADKMGNLSKEMRQEGYTPTAYPKIKGVFDELTNTDQPKDWTELQALRKMIRGAQKSTDPEERRLASILMDEYDTYMMNVPDADVVLGNAKNVGQLWQGARTAYSRMKKAEIFEDMLENAKMDRSKFTQSGAENSMATQLRNLAKNDKKMRLFTKDERDAIEAAAKGSTAQNLLKFFGRFAPTGPVSGIFTGGATVYAPGFGIPMAIGASAARIGATKMREQSINDLINQMRLGSRPQVVGSPFRAVPATTIQGLLNTEDINKEANAWMGM